MGSMTAKKAPPVMYGATEPDRLVRLTQDEAKCGMTSAWLTNYYATTMIAYEYRLQMLGRAQDYLQQCHAAIVKFKADEDMDALPTKKRLHELERALAEAKSDVKFAEKRLAEAIEETS